ncbi:MAG: relaxase/mobilization nuclease domain-containing protein, partial [Aestuariivirga sp.]
EGWRAILGRNGGRSATPAGIGSSKLDGTAQRLEREEQSELRRLKRRTGVGGPGKIGRDSGVGRVRALREGATGRHGGSSRTKAMGLAASLLGQAEGAQAAVVKVSGYGAGAKAARSMLDYNSRKAELSLETERGEVLTTREQRNRMLQEWEPFYDNRKPSDDVATVTLRWRAGDTPDAERLREQLPQALLGHRMAIGIGRSGDGAIEATIVFSLARRKGKRLGWTEAGQAELKRSLVGHLADGDTVPAPALSFAAAGHGPDAVAVQIEAALNRHGSLALDNGLVLTAGGDGLQARDVARLWKRDLRSYATRDVMHLILSAKAGTPKEAFTKAVRGFLGDEFPTHRYAFALHGPDDVKTEKRTQHVHVHAVILMRGKDGRKLDPRIEDLRRWRETMAHHARTQGISMVATRRQQNVNAPSYALGQLHAVQKGLASSRTATRVAARQKGRAVAPTRPEGLLAAAVARHELDELKRGGSRGVETMLARHAEAIGAASRQAVTITDTPDITTLVATFAKVAQMLTHDEERIHAMPDRAAFLRQAREFEGAVARASEALRGDPTLKARFDAETRPMREAIDTQIKRAEIDRTFETALKARTSEAQARENAEAIRREALARGDVTPADRKEENRFRSLAREAAEEARQAEQQLKTLGVQNTDEIARKAELAVAADDERKVGLDRSGAQEMTRPNERGLRRRS